MAGCRTGRGRGDRRAIFISNYRRLVRYDCKIDKAVENCVDDYQAGAAARGGGLDRDQFASVPLIGGNGFYVEDGGMFALGPSGFEQGG